MGPAILAESIENISEVLLLTFRAIFRRSVGTLLGPHFAKRTGCTAMYLGAGYIEDIEFTAILRSVPSVPAVSTKADDEPALELMSPYRPLSHVQDVS
jgi:hypothetical protein